MLAGTLAASCARFNAGVASSLAPGARLAELLRRMRSAIFIESRYGSTLVPGKPLAPVAGRSLLERVWRIARAVRNAERVVVATDEGRIAAHARSFGAEGAMTPEAWGIGLPSR